MIKVGIIGATGYVGCELTRLLLGHPDAQIVSLVSSSSVGQPYESAYPGFAGLGLPLMESAPSPDCDVLFTSLPHGTSAELIPGLVSAGKTVIDMSGDYRYRDVRVYEKWYGVSHPDPALLKKAVYGLPELHKPSIRNAKLIGNPGCYTTCSILALAPLYQNKLIDPVSVVIDAKSGVTGAGKAPTADSHYCEINDNMKAYGIAKHRHTSEIEQELCGLYGSDYPLSFTPHLAPLDRGILATCYATLAQSTTAAELEALYREFYDDAPFVRVASAPPRLNHVVGSNFCNLGITVDERTGRVVVVSVLDNLIKGAAGQAVQNMNIAFDLDEKAGLNSAPWNI